MEVLRSLRQTPGNRAIIARFRNRRQIQTLKDINMTQLNNKITNKKLNKVSQLSKPLALTGGAALA